MAQVVDTAGKQTVVTPSVTRSHGGGNAGYNPGEENQVEPSFEGDESSFGQLVAKVRNQLMMQPPSSQHSVGSSSPASLGSMAQASSPGLVSSVAPDGMASMHSVTQGLPSYEAEEPKEVQWEYSRAEREGDEPRTANYWGEAYEQNGGNDYYVGNTQSNDAYIRNAMANGLSEDEAWAITHRNANSFDSYNTGIDFSGLAERGLDARVYDNLDMAIDDGTAYDYAHMTSEWMTGPQYMKYVEMGMGGRPIDQIDPTQVYNKHDESKEYGYIPFVPDVYVDRTMDAAALMRTPGNIGSAISNLRESATPSYTITYGDGNVIDGKAFDKMAPAYLNQYYYNSRFHPEKYGMTVREYAIPDSSGGISYAHGDLTDYGMNDMIYVTYADGQTIGYTPEEYGSWDVQDGTMMLPEDDLREHGDFVGTSYGLYLTFADGQTIDVSPDAIGPDGNVDLDVADVPIDEANGWLPDDLGMVVSGYGIPDDLVLPDGTRIPFEDVERIYWDETAGDDQDKIDQYGNVTWTDDDISYDFKRYGVGPLSFSNKPRRLMNQEMIDFSKGKDWFDRTDLADNTVDWTLGSIPISAGTILPWVYSMSNVPTSVYGIEPMSRNQATGSYGLMAGDWDEDGNLRYGVKDENGAFDDEASTSTRMWGSLGSAMVPLTEMMVGPVGEQIIPLERLTEGIPFKSDLARLAGNTVAGMAAEGVEEDFGNVFEDLQQYGLRGLFANTMTDESGQPIRDMYGHEARDYGTSLAGRARNAVNPDDLANSFLGGAAVSALMDPLTAPINGNSFVRQVGPAIARDNARKATGVNRYVETDLERDVREALEDGKIPDIPDARRVSDRYLSNFNDDMRGYV